MPYVKYITISVVSLLLLVSTLLPSCTGDRQNGKMSIAQPGFVHAVYFWLSEDDPELRADFVDSGLPALAKVSSIQSVYWGPPAGTDRDVVDNTYDMAWVVTFATAEDQDAYQVDPLHLAFVDKYSGLFEKVQVYDNIVAHQKHITVHE